MKPSPSHVNPELSWTILDQVQECNIPCHCLPVTQKEPEPMMAFRIQLIIRSNSLTKGINIYLIFSYCFQCLLHTTKEFPTYLTIWIYPTQSRYAMLSVQEENIKHSVPIKWSITWPLQTISWKMRTPRYNLNKNIRFI